MADPKLSQDAARDEAVEEALRVLWGMNTDDEDRAALNLLWQCARDAEFERLYGKVVARISADIAGDFDAALNQLEYNAAKRAQDATREECCKAMCKHCAAGRPASLVTTRTDLTLWVHGSLSGTWPECSASPIRNLSPVGEKKHPSGAAVESCPLREPHQEHCYRNGRCKCGAVREETPQPEPHYIARGVTTPCRECGGLGVKAYPDTRTWRRGGAAGQMITSDVCDRCWGSGDEYRHWLNLRFVRKWLEPHADEIREEAARAEEEGR